jgi:hypothetical protein
MRTTRFLETLTVNVVAMSGEGYQVKLADGPSDDKAAQWRRIDEAGGMKSMR